MGCRSRASPRATRAARRHRLIAEPEARPSRSPVDLTVPPRTIHTITLSSTYSTAYVDYAGKVVVDADLDVELRRNGRRVVNRLMERLRPLSHYVPSDNQRRLTLKGQIWNGTASEVRRTDEQAPLPIPLPHCPGDPRVLDGEAVAFLSAGTEAGLAAPTLDDFGEDLVDPVPAPPVLTTSPLVSGMSIRTADVVGNVKVRAKSLGPGFCAVSISATGGGRSNFMAPPLTWSPWATLYSHLGASSALLSAQADCDTGALFEVQYFR